MSCSLNSLKGIILGIIWASIMGLLRRILGVKTIAHVLNTLRLTMPGSFDYAMENAAERAAGRENAEHVGGSPSSEIRERLVGFWFPSA